jgi:hypothetical protein
VEFEAAQARVRKFAPRTHLEFEGWPVDQMITGEAVADGHRAADNDEVLRKVGVHGEVVGAEGEGGAKSVGHFVSRDRWTGAHNRGHHGAAQGNLGLLELDGARDNDASDGIVG